MPKPPWFARLFGNREQSQADRPQLTAEVRERIRAAFNEAAADEEHFPSTIDPRIEHVKLILRFFGVLASGRVLDIGCGKGRFARIVAERNPAGSVYAVDIAEAMLRFVRSGIHIAAASMTALPFADETFDAAYATESLEHAVEIDTAVVEMCRVVKPGGRIVIIDKNAEQWGRLETPEWERWFTRSEIEQLLARHCRDVSSRFISYWADVPPDGLFIAWQAVK